MGTTPPTVWTTPGPKSAFWRQFSPSEVRGDEVWFVVRLPLVNLVVGTGVDPVTSRFSGVRSTN